MANIAAKLRTYQNRVLAQNSHKKFVGVVSESNACHALFSKQKCWHNLPKKPTVCSMKTFLFFQHSIHYILITITQNNKERNNHIISSNVAKQMAQKELKKNWLMRLKKGATNLARQKYQACWSRKIRDLKKTLLCQILSYDKICKTLLHVKLG